MTPVAMLNLLRQWREAGWLRALDLAFARFVHELDAETPASLLLAAALVTHLEGQGHSCLPIDALARDPAGLLGWPAEAVQAVVGAMAEGSTGARADGFEDAATDATADPLGGGLSARTAWAGRKLLQIDPQGDRGTSPLVLSGERLYLRRYWHHETRVAAQVRARTQVGADETGAWSEARCGVARRLLDRLFPSAAAASASPTIDSVQRASSTDWQKVACALALRSRLTIVTGGPGTGKTYTAARLLVLLQALHDGREPLRIALAAPTGKAAARLRQSIAVALEGLREASIAPTSGSSEWGASAASAELPPARTLHALLGARPGTRRFLHDAANPLPLDLLFIDEASMVHLEMMAALLDALPPEARLVLLGDKDQLASVEAGAVLGDLCRSVSGDAWRSFYRPDTLRWIEALTGDSLGVSSAAVSSPSGAALDVAQQTVVLRRSHRFAGPIEALAAAVNRGDGEAALGLLRSSPDGALALIEASDAAAVPALAVDGRAAVSGLSGVSRFSGFAGFSGGYRDYLEALTRRPAEAEAFDGWVRDVLARFDRFRVLCAVHAGPWGEVELNASIERMVRHQGFVKAHGEWYEGRPVMVTRNDASLGVFNGDIGMVLRPQHHQAPMRAYFPDGAGLRSVAIGRLADVVTAFAMTVHKSQGSEFDHVALVLPNDAAQVLTRELVYTGITRARRALTLVASDAALLASASSRLTRRFGGLADLIERNGFE